jgi:porphobilinogen synthase
MRQVEVMRQLIRETHLTRDQLVMPVFVRPGRKLRVPIPSLPGQFQHSVDELVKECHDLVAQGVLAVLLFGLPKQKDEQGSEAYATEGIIQQAVRAIKAATPQLLVITDVCLCAYTSHGHCGMVTGASGLRRAASGTKPSPSRSSSLEPRFEREVSIDNEATLELLAKTALSHARAGADLVAPSDMMDGNVLAIRTALDANGFERIPIMAYSAKFASTFYSPFREAVGSSPAFGDRRTYQMDPANAEEALREARLDIEQGADIIMVKPALAYLDVIYRIKQAFHHPVAAFNVSGEYAMVKAASARGWIHERPAWFEMLLGLRRAGADILITYWAKDAAELLSTNA